MPMTLGAVRDALAKYPADHPSPVSFVNGRERKQTATFEVKYAPCTVDDLASELAVRGTDASALLLVAPDEVTTIFPSKTLLRAWLGPVPAHKLPETYTVQEHGKRALVGGMTDIWIEVNDDGQFTAGGYGTGELTFNLAALHWLRTGEVEGA